MSIQRIGFRIVLVIAAAVVIPSILLSVISILGVRNERAAVQQKIEQSYAGVAKEAIKGVLDAVANAESELKARLEEISTDSMKFPRMEGLFEDLHSGNSSLKHAFLLDGQGEILFPTLNVHADRQLTAEAIPVTTELILRNGRLSEFVRRDPLTAIRRYREAEKLRDEAALECAVLNSVARCYFKLGDFHNAIEAYQTLIERFPGWHDSAGVNLSLAARYQITLAYQGLGDNEGYLESLLSLLDYLLESEGLVDANQYAYYEEKAISDLEDVMQNTNAVFSQTFMDRYDELMARRERREKKRQFLAYFEASLKPRIQAVTSVSSGSSPQRVPFLAQDGWHVISYFPLAGRGEMAGFEVDLEYLRDDMVNKTADRLGLGENVTLTVTEGANPEALITETFPHPFAFWQMGIIIKQFDALERLAQMRARLYAWAVILLITSIAGGAIVALRMVAREMRLAQLKSDFVSNVSHELKTPLTSIRMFIETLLLKRYSSETEAEEYLGVIQKESERLTRLVDRVLDFSRIDKGKKEFQFRDENIREVITSAIEAFRSQAEEAGCELEVNLAEDLPGQIKIDRDAISEALLNLLSNAVKYSKDEKKIIVNAQITGEYVAIEVIDNGIGIPKREQKKIFERFYRVDDVLSREIKGSGLGLALVEYIAEAHGGKVAVESRVGEGSKFTLLLPTD